MTSTPKRRELTELVNEIVDGRHRRSVAGAGRVVRPGRRRRRGGDPVRTSNRAPDLGRGHHVDGGRSAVECAAGRSRACSTTPASSMRPAVRSRSLSAIGSVVGVRPRHRNSRTRRGQSVRPVLPSRRRRERWRDRGSVCRSSAKWRQRHGGAAWAENRDGGGASVGFRLGVSPRVDVVLTFLSTCSGLLLKQDRHRDGCQEHTLERNDMNIESTQEQTPNRTRRSTALGVAAGVLGGGADRPADDRAVVDERRRTTIRRHSSCVPVVALQDDDSRRHRCRPSRAGRAAA